MAHPTTTWIEQFQELVHYQIGPVPATPAVMVGSLIAVGLGLALAFRSSKLLRPMVTAVGVVVGTWAGIQLAAFVGTPAPITAALCAVIFAALTFKTYRVWLVVGSIVTLFFIATTYELGQGDLTRYLPVVKTSRDAVTLPTGAEQRSNLHPDRAEQVRRLGDRVMDELRGLGPRGWFLPVIAAVIGGILAWKVLNIFAIVWVGLLGAVTSVLGGVTFLCANWPDMRTPITARPQVVAGVMIGLWLLGLIYQAKEARLPKPKPAAPKPDAPKS